MRLISIFFLISTLFISCSTLAPHKEKINPNDIVRWSDTTKLTWNDFQGKPIEESSIAAEIFIQYNVFMQKPALFLPAISTVECYVDKRISWVVKSKVTPQLLFYNQTLFDLYELYSRKLRKKISESSFGIADPGGVLNSLYNENQLELMQKISQYRDETGMGTNNKKIKEWSTKLAGELKDLYEYGTK